MTLEALFKEIARMLHKAKVEGDQARIQNLQEIFDDQANQCTGCSGTGRVICDSYDHRGEHVQSELGCEECMGTGVKEANT